MHISSEEDMHAGPGNSRQPTEPSLRPRFELQGQDRSPPEEGHTCLSWTLEAASASPRALMLCGMEELTEVCGTTHNCNKSENL